MGMTRQPGAHWPMVVRRSATGDDPWPRDPYGLAHSGAGRRPRRHPMAALKLHFLIILNNKLVMNSHL
jgi:hypothetical protein